ncbi:hypothetical protein PJP10_31580, partial [Mycobacterium kansasii]
MFELLTSLNPKFEPVRAQILGSPSLPLLNSIYALLLRDEKRQTAMGSTVVKKYALVTGFINFDNIRVGCGRGTGRESHYGGQG